MAEIIYKRESHPYTLDEILFIATALKSGYSIARVSKKVLRSPDAIVYKFLTYRKYENGVYTSDTVEEYQSLKEREKWILQKKA